MRTRPEGDPQQMAQCVYSTPCGCGRSYIGETGRLRAVWLRDHRHNLKKGLPEQGRLGRSQDLEIENNSRHRKYK
jgi:hypothetical protein